MKKTLLPFLFFIFVPIASAQILLEPSSFQIEMVGGDKTTKIISLVWKGEVPAVAYLGYEIEQVNGSFNGSEMWVEFSENPVILEPNKVKNVEVTLATKPSIYPGEYLVKIFANTSIEQVVKKETSTRIVTKQVNVTVLKNITEEKWYENTTKISQLKDKIEILENKLSNYSSYIEKLNEEIREKDELVEICLRIIVALVGAIVLIIVLIKFLSA